FNPCQEVKKIIDFDREADQVGCISFTVWVEEGILTWSKYRLPRKHVGFIAIIDRAKLAIGLTNQEWRRLQAKIASELTEQRKAW
ncbi:hypothetical protein LCGC14_2690030, partial [marine sediment metagenome]